MRVEEGQVLARLDDTQIRTQLALAAAQLAAAEKAWQETAVRLEEAKLNLRRTGDLAGQESAASPTSTRRGRRSTRWPPGWRPRARASRWPGARWRWSASRSRTT
jgi:multidrug resistance efflux pump